MPLILLIIGVVLIVYNYRAIRKENETKNENSNLDISFKNVLQDNKEELDDYKMELGLLRKDIAESLTELQEEIFYIKKDVNGLKENGKIFENNNEEIKEVEHIDYKINDSMILDLKLDDGIASEVDFSEEVDSDKTKSIRKLLSEGLTEEEICHELSVSKGEVLLVKGLFKK